MKKFFRVFFLILLVLLISFLFSLVYIYIRYTSWEEEFEKNIDRRNIITSESIKDLDIQSKIVKFTLSQSNTEYLQLDVNEFGSILFTVLNSYIGEDIELKSMYIQPEEGEWIIYLKTKYRDFSFWVSFNIKKDNIQTVQIYTSEIFVGPFSMHRYTNWIDMINRGIGESVVTLNENGFVGRYLENIELLENSVVLKGSRY